MHDRELSACKIYYIMHGLEHSINSNIIANSINIVECKTLGVSQNPSQSLVVRARMRRYAHVKVNYALIVSTNLATEILHEVARVYLKVMFINGYKI